MVWDLEQTGWVPNPSQYTQAKVMDFGGSRSQTGCRAGRTSARPACEDAGSLEAITAICARRSGPHPGCCAQALLGTPGLPQELHFKVTSGLLREGGPMLPKILGNTRRKDEQDVPGGSSRRSLQGPRVDKAQASHRPSCPAAASVTLPSPQDPSSQPQPCSVLQRRTASNSSRLWVELRFWNWGRGGAGLTQVGGARGRLELSPASVLCTGV